MACLLIPVSLAATWVLRRGASADPEARAVAESQSAPDATALIPAPGDAAEQPKPTRPTEATPIDLPRVPGTPASDWAVTRWTERVRQNAADVSAWTELGDALMQKARETMDAGYYAHAERAYGKALALNSQCVAATIGMAWVYGCRHEFEMSIDWANKALALDSRNATAYGLLGDADMELGDYEAAFEHYQKMLDLRPDISSYSRGAHLLHVTGDVRKAAWLMEKAIAAGAPHAENTAWCCAQLALIHFGHGNVLGAEQVLEKALAKAPDNFHLLAARGKVKAGRKDFAGAIACYEKAGAIAPRHEVVAALSDLYRLTGNGLEAAKQEARVEAIHKLNRANGVRGDSQLAQFYADHDRNLPEALQLAEEEYKTRKNVFVADTLAWCYFKNGRYHEAQQVIQKALRKRTPEASFLFHAGMIHATLGDRRTAQLNLYQAMSLNPNFSPIDGPRAAERLQELGSRPPDSKSAAIGGAQP